MPATYSKIEYPKTEKFERVYHIDTDRLFGEYKPGPGEPSSAVVYTVAMVMLRFIEKYDKKEVPVAALAKYLAMSRITVRAAIKVMLRMNVFARLVCRDLHDTTGQPLTSWADESYGQPLTSKWSVADQSGDVNWFVSDTCEFLYVDTSPPASVETALASLAPSLPKPPARKEEEEEGAARRAAPAAEPPAGSGEAVGRPVGRGVVGLVRSTGCRPSADRGVGRRTATGGEPVGRRAVKAVKGGKAGRPGSPYRRSSGNGKAGRKPEVSEETAALYRDVNWRDSLEGKFYSLEEGYGTDSDPVWLGMRFTDERLTDPVQLYALWCLIYYAVMEREYAYSDLCVKSAEEGLKQAKGHGARRVAEAVLCFLCADRADRKTPWRLKQCDRTFTSFSCKMSIALNMNPNAIKLLREPAVDTVKEYDMSPEVMRMCFPGDYEAVQRRTAEAWRAVREG